MAAHELLLGLLLYFVLITIALKGWWALCFSDEVSLCYPDTIEHISLSDPLSHPPECLELEVCAVTSTLADP